jgi:hypothetical protein
MLFDLETFKCINASQAKKNKYLHAIISKTPKRTLDKAIEYIDEALKSIEPSASTSLIWTRMSCHVGRRTLFLSPENHDHFWQMLINPICATKDGNIFAGAFFMWRVACVAEETGNEWVTNKKETEIWDDYSQQKIYYRQYWINKGEMILPI